MKALIIIVAILAICVFMTLSICKFMHKYGHASKDFDSNLTD